MPHHERTLLIIVMVAVLGGAVAACSEEGSAVPAEISNRFEYLSQNGNSACSAEFQESIATMAPTARLQGSCCSPMDLHRYGEQIDGLKQFSDVPIVPPDPYDVEAGLAQRLLAGYDTALSADEQGAYDYATANSDEKGPCCCKCWRWHVFGGLGKLLIHEHGFTGQQVATVWDLSDGCGGDEDHA